MCGTVIAARRMRSRARAARAESFSSHAVANRPAAGMTIWRRIPAPEWTNVPGVARPHYHGMATLFPENLVTDGGDALSFLGDREFLVRVAMQAWAGSGVRVQLDE